MMTLCWFLYQSRPEKNPELPEGCEKRILARAKTSFGGGFQDHLVDGVVSVIRVTPFCLLVIMYWAIYSQVSYVCSFSCAEIRGLRLVCKRCLDTQSVAWRDW